MKRNAKTGIATTRLQLQIDAASAQIKTLSEKIHFADRNIYGMTQRLAALEKAESGRTKSAQMFAPMQEVERQARVLDANIHNLSAAVADIYQLFNQQKICCPVCKATLPFVK